MMNGFNIGNIHVKVPVVQGGMGVQVSLSGLASAVANEGGVGVISAVGIGLKDGNKLSNYKNANKEGLIHEIRRAKSLTDGVLGVNIMMAVTDFDELFKVSVEEKINLIIVGAGLLLKLPEGVTFEMIDQNNTKIVPKVSSAKAAKVIFEYWWQHTGRVPDAIVVEGPLAGGHLGFKRNDLSNPAINLAQIVTETVAVIKHYEELSGKEIPVIAGGGIYTGEDIYNMMKTGAKAVKMGSRFVTTHECDASIEFKNAYINAKEEDLVIIQSPVGLPGRVIRNEFVDELNAGVRKPINCPWKCLKSCNYKEVPYCIAMALKNAAAGNMKEGFAFSGHEGYRATEIISVKETFEILHQEYSIAEAKG